MRFNVGDVVISDREVIESACGDHPELLLCKKGQRLVVKKCFPAKDYPSHGVDSYLVQDETETYGQFFMDCTELKGPITRHD